MKLERGWACRGAANIMIAAMSSFEAGLLSRYSNCKGIAWSDEQGCVVLGALADTTGASPGWQQFERVRAKGVYINNCKYGLHGPIEILSSTAVTELVRGRERCAKHFTHECGGECAWGEDLFIDQCLWKVSNKNLSPLGDQEETVGYVVN